MIDTVRVAWTTETTVEYGSAIENYWPKRSVCLLETVSAHSVLRLNESTSKDLLRQPVTGKITVENPNPRSKNFEFCLTIITHKPIVIVISFNLIMAILLVFMNTKLWGNYNDASLSFIFCFWAIKLFIYYEYTVMENGRTIVVLNSLAVQQMHLITFCSYTRADTMPKPL